MLDLIRRFLGLPLPFNRGFNAVPYFCFVHLSFIMELRTLGAVITVIFLSLPLLEKGKKRGAWWWYKV